MCANLRYVVLVSAHFDIYQLILAIYIYIYIYIYKYYERKKKDVTTFPDKPVS